MSTPTSDGSSDNGPDIDPTILDALEGLPADFSGFGRVYQETLQPELRQREARRLRIARRATQATWLGWTIAAFGAVIGLLVFRAPPFAMVAAIVGFGVAGAGRAPVRKMAQEAKGLLVQPVAQQFGLDHVARPGPVRSAIVIQESGLLPSWNRSDYEDHITGERNGISFEFFEAHLEQRRTTRTRNGRTRTRWVTVFRGQCLRFDFHKRFHGRTLVLRDAGILNRFGSVRDLQRARLESPDFEDTFEVYTSDQVEARYLLTPDLMQRLLDLENTFRGSGLRCAFVDGELQIVLEGADLFEPGSMFTPLDNPDRIRDLLDDFAAVFNLIDSFDDGR
ncbi:MAG: DUF3137 domain-containing protein [Henriciella sp.]|nr:DUF3137 domain-containing protein [Henriciella sp.]